MPLYSALPKSVFGTQTDALELPFVPKKMWILATRWLVLVIIGYRKLLCIQRIWVSKTAYVVEFMDN